MGFNWVTFLAQIVNLFILVVLLKKFLYGPIVDTIAKRQAYIENKVKEANEATKAAEKRENELITAVENWKKGKQKRADELFVELKKIKHEQEEQIEEENKKARQKMQSDLDREKISLSFEIRDMLAQNFLELSKKILKDLSGLSPLDQAIALFQKKVLKLTKTEKLNINKSYNKHGVIYITSSEALTKKSQSDLARFVQNSFKIENIKDIKFKVDPGLILGIELVAGEIVLEWNLKSYLDTFEGNLNAALSGLVIKEE